MQTQPTTGPLLSEFDGPWPGHHTPGATDQLNARRAGSNDQRSRGKRTRPLVHDGPHPRSQAALTTHRLIGADGALRQSPSFRTIDADTSLSICLRCATLNAMSAMAEVGHAIALLPDDPAKPTWIRLFPLTPAFTSEIWLLTHPELRRTGRIRLLMEHLHASFRNDARLRGAKSAMNASDPGY
jgi:DNA-binding transcriptional LysR family regulator